MRIVWLSLMAVVLAGGAATADSQQEQRPEGGPVAEKLRVKGTKFQPAAEAAAREGAQEYANMSGSVRVEATVEIVLKFTVELGSFEDCAQAVARETDGKGGKADQAHDAVEECQAKIAAALKELEREAANRDELRRQMAEERELYKTICELHDATFSLEKVGDLCFDAGVELGSERLLERALRLYEDFGQMGCLLLELVEVYMGMMWDKWNATMQGKWCAYYYLTAKTFILSDEVDQDNEEPQ